MASARQSDHTGREESTNIVGYPNLKVLVLLYHLYDEMEFDIVVAILRRAGIPVTIAGKDLEPVLGSKDIKKLPETTIEDALTKGPYDCVVLIGGKDAWKALSECPKVGELLKDQEKSGRLIASICTAAIVLKHFGILYGKKLTTYPKVEDQVKAGNKYIFQQNDVVEDGNLITSRGNFTSFQWALRIVERLTTKKNAQDVATEMIVVY